MTITFHARSHGFHVLSSVTPFTFPGGETHFKGTVPEDEDGSYCVIRGVDANDFIAAAMWAQVIHAAGKSVTVYVPYLPGARADRGTPLGAGVYAQLINDIGAEHVVAFDPHSPVMPALINNFTAVTSVRLINRVLGGPEDTTYTGIIAPDKGAHDRAAAVGKALNLPVYNASKTRIESSGNLLDFHCEPLPEGGKYLVVDDICDGGGTFRGLAAVTGLPREQLGLFVSHGIFSGKAADLNEHFGEIITTDSHPGAHNPAVGARVVPVLRFIHGIADETNNRFLTDDEPWVMPPELEALKAAKAAAAAANPNAA